MRFFEKKNYLIIFLGGICVEKRIISVKNKIYGKQIFIRF